MNRFLVNGLLNMSKRGTFPTQIRGFFNYGMNRPFELMQETNHAREHGVKFWRKITYFVALPMVAIFSVIILYQEHEHSKHPRPPFVEYEHLYNQKKPFPWGDGKHSLFHNPVTNAVAGVGYEVPDPNEGHGNEKH